MREKIILENCKINQDSIDFVKKKNEIALLLENNKKIQGLKVTANDMIEEINQ